jgi:crotonobetainyl-CoA:carnitine CoA-transferase CaiB-like acyl-CoA transferase
VTTTSPSTGGGSGGEVGAQAGPLAGIRVIDLSIAATGPYAAALLADQGAEVIKVERPGIGDLARWVGTSHNGVSALFVNCNRGKRSIAIDIHTPDGVDIVRRLAAQADVVVQNYRPGVLDRVGLGYDDLRIDNPDLVYVSLSGFGATGPYAGKSAYDTVIQAYAGLANAQAGPDGAPVFLRQTAADKVTALTAAQAITAALFARERGSGGQHVELSMLDAVVSFLWVDAAGNEVLTEADGSMPSSLVAGFEPMPFADGWGIATPTSDADFAGICRAFGVDGYDDPEVATMVARMTNRDAVRRVMERVYAAAALLPTREAMARLEAERVPCGELVAPADLPDDPHALAIGLFEEHDDPAAGRVRLPRHPTRFGATPSAIRGAAPALGQHTDEILGELGLGDRIDELRASAAVA